MRPLGAVVRDYVAISKPRIIFLLLIVAYAAMFVASRGLPDPVAFLAVTLAGTFSTASAGAFNHVLERERDARMPRTADRPVAAGRIRSSAALGYAAVLAVLSFIVLAWPGLWLAAYLTIGAIAYYVVVYTVVLKPTTPQNIVIGGFAGSFPALIGWSAATGGLAGPAWILAGIVFVWTPAHFWALAILYKEDYAKGGYPMMPNVHGDRSTLRQIVVYSVLTLVVSLLLWPDHAGGIYLAAAVVLGTVLVVRSVRLMRDPRPARTRSFFLWSIMYLGLLLATLMVDRVVAGGAL